MPSDITYDVFLSYSSQDKPRVRALAERLRSAGLRVWFDDWVVRPGDDIYLAVEHGLGAARVQVLCLSPEALASDWVTLERSTVLFRDPGNAGRRFVPLLLANCELPDTLRRYKYVDYREATRAAFEQLLAACRSEAELPPPAPKREQRAERPKPKPTVEVQPLAELERKLTGHKGWVFSVAVSPDAMWVVSGSGDNTIRAWDLETGKCRVTLKGHTDDVNSVAITPDGKQILSGSDDHSIRIWDVADGREVACWQSSGDLILAVAPLPDGRRIITAGAVGALEIWDVASQQRLATLEGHSGPAKSVAVSKDGRRAVSGSGDNTVRLWDLEGGKCLATLNGHSGIVASVQITPDGRFAFSGSADKTIKIWSLDTGTCLATLEGHQQKVHSVALSPDGTRLASTGFTDYTVRLWDWRSGACLQVIRYKEPDTPISVAFSPDGSRLIVGMADEAAAIFVYRIAAARPAPPAEPTRRYVNAKVVLLGEGAVGKTSLAHRLVEDKYVVKDRTHGMNVWPLELPLPPDATMDREALLWDLAGQEDYRLIHRLFLDETALALLLINPQKDDPFAEAGDWLKALDTATGGREPKREPARLLIFSQVDVGGMKLGNAKIERFAEQHRFAAWLASSAKTGENCSDQANGGKPSHLKQLIAESIPWDNLPWTATPRLLAELKNAVMKMRAAADIRLLRFAELAQRLEQALPGEKFGESDVRTAVTLLANYGLAQPLKFGDLVLLQPELLNGYAGAIIRSARAHRDEIGSVLEADIYQPDFDFTGVDRLPRADEELLLRALVQTLLDHSLCIAEETPRGRQLVFPS
ncbi:MAG: TIR domain-containing protein, partial [Bryobacteraceae bacterium]